MNGFSLPDNPVLQPGVEYPLFGSDYCDSTKQVSLTVYNLTKSETMIVTLYYASDDKTFVPNTVYNKLGPGQSMTISPTGQLGAGSVKATVMSPGGGLIGFGASAGLAVKSSAVVAIDAAVKL